MILITLGENVSQINIGNARDPEQKRRMEELKAKGLCYFCRQGKRDEGTAPKILHENIKWFISPNDFPLEGSVHHYLLVPKRHIKDCSEIGVEESWELFQRIIPWIKNHTQTDGYSLFVRSGNMTLTGATLDHLHFHFLVGGPKPETVRYPDDIVPVVIAYKKR
jgi:diadenosine tetraphosphate (Ap4A) HIT family hydrolase